MMGRFSPSALPALLMVTPRPFIALCLLQAEGGPFYTVEEAAQPVPEEEMH